MPHEPIDHNLTDPRYIPPVVNGWIWCGNTEPGQASDEIAAVEVYRGSYSDRWELMAQPFTPRVPGAQPCWAVYRRRA